MRALFIMTLALAALVFCSPARADEVPSNYYDNQLATCEREPPDWFFGFLYGWFGDDSMTMDSCCRASVEMMRANLGHETPDHTCPPGFRMNTLKCPTSKFWCEDENMVLPAPAKDTQD